jgi:hypothetical protein
MMTIQMASQLSSGTGKPANILIIIKLYILLPNDSMPYFLLHVMFLQIRYTFLNIINLVASYTR